MASLDERIAAHERKVEEERELLRQLKADRTKRERERRREAERRVRQQEQNEALAFWHLLHEHDVIANGSRVSAFDFVSTNVIPRLVDDEAINRDG